MKCRQGQPTQNIFDSFALSSLSLQVSSFKRHSYLGKEAALISVLKKPREGCCRP